MVYTTMYASQYMSQYSTFDKLFTFTNPREKYSQIEDIVLNYNIRNNDGKLELFTNK